MIYKVLSLSFDKETLVEGSNRCYRGQGETESTETCTESRWCIKVTGSGK